MCLAPSRPAGMFCSFPEPNSFNPTMTNTHNLLPTVIETMNQTPPGALTQRAIPLVSQTLTLRNDNKNSQTVCTCASPFVCTCVCGLSGDHILPQQQHGHLGDTHPFLNYLPRFFHPHLHPSFFINHQQRGGRTLWRLLRCTRSPRTLSSCIFPPGYVPRHKHSPPYIGDDLKWANQGGVSFVHSGSITSKIFEREVEETPSLHYLFPMNKSACGQLILSNQLLL